MGNKYYFTCFHEDCIAGHKLFSPVEFDHYQQVEKVFKEHAEKLHICKFWETKS